jgi:hypothetical protein
MMLKGYYLLIKARDRREMGQTLFQNDLKPKGTGHKDEIACIGEENRDRSPKEWSIVNC